jgi:predicted Zn-dependent protease
VHYAYGLYLMESDQEAALQEFRAETETHPDAWAAWLVRASLETKAGAPEAALADVGRARPLVPAGVVWLCETEAAKANSSLGKNEEAIAEFQNAIRTHPDYAQLHFYLSQAYARAGRKPEAAREKADFLRLTSQQDPLATAQ